MRKKVLITGGDGQLAKALLNTENLFKVIALNKKQLNILCNDQVLNIIEKMQPNVVIHCAAYTKVDECEHNIQTAYDVNYAGTKNIAFACKKVEATMIYISTDYVFDGKKGAPYTEQDIPSPINVYGYTKLLGEQIVKATLDKYFIVRTSWLYGGHGKHFVNTILQLAKKNSEIRVVNDQIGCPTYVMDLAQAVFKLIDTEAYGIYHASNSGYCSWYQFANEILKCSGNRNALLIPITSDELNSAAKRPNNSSLINTKGIYQFRNWKEALHEYIEKNLN
ncbi:MAG: dTDP-4-dehydrorhamnose reductase [Clostridiales bacterium]|nr:dTDP-4-dehydrorhamnose reductase [Clostridiales bacterium]MDK2932694.1 dTDP-4-dehydrorhamnose reductase [Clostridiales bacterium]